MERIGQRLGHYRLSRLIGQGGFADVYLGEHIHLKSYAAIKIMHTRLTSELQDSFLNEARTLALLVHPRIIRVLDFGIDQQTAYLVMDYAPHGTLRQRHPTGVRLSPQTVAGYLDQIAAGLHYAHHQKLIHRDLKPDNVLINAQHDLQIADFGVALIVQTTQPLKTSEEFAGTVTYMAPEQLLGKPQFASDQYALGIMAYEWLSGCRPFEGTFTELFIQHQHTPPTSLCELVLGLPPAINQVVLTALDKDPTRRFSTIKAFASAFSAAVAQAYPSTALVRPEESFSTVHMSLAYQEAQPVHTSGNAASRSAEAISASALSTGPVSRPASVAPLHTP
ncbi:MAG: serine/threonine protein kinase, partial [Ktedonobacteraceae bacterium]|nr:serine/threonine protein kinase [Ktedonobacteraceae bacterium]